MGSVTHDSDGVLTTNIPIQTATAIPRAGRANLALACADFRIIDVLIHLGTRQRANNFQ